MQVSMSSQFAQYPGSNAIDGNYENFVASQWETDAWLSVRVPSNTAIGYVAVYMRRDAYAYLLGTFEIWLGASYGHRGYKCGESAWAQSHGNNPYWLWCGGLNQYGYVTILRTGAAGYLTFSELEAYTVLSPPPPLIPTPPPSPPPPPPTITLPSPPPPPALPKVLALREAASLSSFYSRGYEATQCIDGSVSTICATGMMASPWLSVRLPINTAVGEVRVHNRRDRWNYLLGTFEVWQGDGAFGQMTRLCGGLSHLASHEPSPYVIDCGGVTSTYVTLVRTGPGNGWLTIAELEVYTNAA